MLRHLSVRRSLAVTAVIAVSILSTGALPATADQGGNGRGAEHSTVKKNHKDDTVTHGGSEKSQGAGKPTSAPKPGMKIAIHFDTTFAGKKKATEEVTMLLESDGIWRPVGYYIQ